jgi:hypothetical protein
MSQLEHAMLNMALAVQQSRAPGEHDGVLHHVANLIYVRECAEMVLSQWRSIERMPRNDEDQTLRREMQQREAEHFRRMAEARQFP